MTPIIGTDLQGRTTYTYEYSGFEEVLNLPVGTNIFIEAWGASGGPNTTRGGKGGYASGNYTVNAPLHVLVGGAGGNSNGGFNGGGQGGSATYKGGGGGGSSDVRLTPGGQLNSLESRIIVAGGGGGGGGKSSAPSNYGGIGGGLIGGRNTGESFNGYGGTQTEGGKAGISGVAGGFGIGGSAQAGLNIGDYGGGGGGGGYYGGAAGGPTTSSGTGGAGGGGSSYIAMLREGITTSGANVGNGKIVITLLNATPTLTVHSPSNNLTLYENDTLSISGTTSDADNGNSVTIRYQINANTVRAIKAFIANGTVESFSKSLIFRGGNLYDGDILIASGLTEGVPHTLKVWATDDQGGTSPIVERDFYVVPNRVPLLTVNPPIVSGNINTDKIKIDGTYSDPDGNTAKVTYRINGSTSVQVSEGKGGPFDFEITFGQLNVGLNNIVIEAIDSYGAKTSRTVKLQKNEVKTEQLKSTARYKILPPLETATGVVIWVRRDENLALSASISMGQTGEAESFVPMIKKEQPAPVPNVPGMLEDQFHYENATPADNIILQLDLERSSLTADEKIHVLIGVID